MTENGNGAQAQVPQQPRMQVLAQFIRDMSFENVVAQKGLSSGDVQPEMQVQVSLDARKRPVFVELPQAQYAQLRTRWNLPEIKQ